MTGDVTSLALHLLFDLLLYEDNRIAEAGSQIGRTVPIWQRPPQSVITVW